MFACCQPRTDVSAISIDDESVPASASVRDANISSRHQVFFTSRISMPSSSDRNDA